MTDTSSELNEADIERFGPDPGKAFAENLAQVQERIARAADRSGRSSDQIRLLPVTKTVPARILRHAHAAGMTRFAENKLQEARDKSAILSGLDIDWSIVGHLQTNKVKYLVRLASEFHALDSVRLATELQRRLELEDRTLDVYVQVNTSGEESKFGLHPDDLLAFIDGLADYPRLRPRGLMTLAIFSSDTDRVRDCFRLLRRLRDQAERLDPRIIGLSMGMSGDYETAIEEGASIVRVGQAILGRRPGSDAHYWPGLIPAND